MRNKRFLEITLSCRCAVDVLETLPERGAWLSMGDSFDCERHGPQTVVAMVPLCGCGELLHYTDPVNEAYIKGLCKDLGEYVKITVPGRGAWMVQRHFIALHGIKAEELEGSQWEKVE